MDFAGVSLEGEDLLPAVRVPDLHRMVQGAAGQALAVRAVGHLLDTRCVSLQGAEFLPGQRVPQLHGLVAPAGRGELLAIRAEGHRPDQARVPFEGADLLSRGRVPSFRVSSVLQEANRLPSGLYATRAT